MLLWNQYAEEESSWLGTEESEGERHDSDTLIQNIWVMNYGCGSLGLPGIKNFL